MLQVLLSAAVPFQKLIDQTSPTHQFINSQALMILSADGRVNEARWLHQFLSEFNSGCDWADSGWMNIGHMYDPRTQAGFNGWPNAVELAQTYWNRASDLYLQRNFPQAFFYLGAAAHLVQDLCVPHHAAARVFAGHKQFEQMARRHRHEHAVNHSGLYNLSDQASGWIVGNASYTRECYSHCITTDLDPGLRWNAIADLLPRAQRTTAGFVSAFIEQIAQGGEPTWDDAPSCSLPDSDPGTFKQPMQ